MTAICAFETFEHVSNRREGEFALSDAVREHGVRGMPCLLPDLERRDAGPSRARREPGAQALARIASATCIGTIGPGRLAVRAHRAGNDIRLRP
jgi:hypothetical protein